MVNRNLTKLTFSVSSAFSGLGSLDLYCVWDGLDYRITPEALQKVLGSGGGAGIMLTGVQSIAAATDHTVTWSSVMYEDGAGWTDMVNSPTCLFAPRDMVAIVTYGQAWTSVGPIAVRETILRNNSFNNDESWPSRRYVQTAAEKKFVHSMPMALSSGDCVNAIARNDSGVSRNLSADCVFFIRPLIYG